MNKEEILKQVRDFADRAHGNQRRKYTPDRYIVHPVRVMELSRAYNDALPVLAAALLHDVLEDTPTTEDDILEFLQGLMEEEDARKTVKLVVELSDVYVKDNYPKWNRRKRKAAEVERLSNTSPEAQTIKYADIIDNSVEIVSHDVDFGRVFLRECRALLKGMNQGHPELYQRAIDTVNQGLEQLAD